MRQYSNDKNTVIFNIGKISNYLIFTRESSYCFQHVLAIAILSICPSVHLSVRLSHGWISQKRCKLESQIFYRRLPGRF